MQESTRSAPHGPPAAAAASSAGQAAPLAGKVAFITGAGRGIGRALALGFARAGARVCCAARTPGELDETARAIVAAGGQAIAVPADVTDPDAIERALDTCEARFGGIDVAVLNAGSPNLRKRAIDTSPEEWRRTVEVNLTGSFVTARALIPRLKRRGGGRMILVGSGTGRRAGPAASAYACAKAGVWMLTRVLAQRA